MNEDILKGQWRQLKGSIQKKWGEITDDDMAQIDGEREKMVGKLQERYGYSREKAENELDAYLSSNERATTKN
ncbi:MAG: CsbD family protein [Caldilineaceae bacterium]|jgi:uncharacterized protein YjbJ (UPF0337 family)|nr:CsbD family protein [Caldilineaceae bacterium]